MIAVLSGGALIGLTCVCQFGRRNELSTWLGPVPVTNQLATVFYVLTLEPYGNEDTISLFLQERQEC